MLCHCELVLSHGARYVGSLVQNACYRHTAILSTMAKPSSFSCEMYACIGKTSRVGVICRTTPVGRFRSIDRSEYAKLAWSFVLMVSLC